MPVVQLMVTRHINNGFIGESLSGPHQALRAHVDVACQDHHIHALVDALLALDSLKRGKFDMQIR